MVRKSNPPWKSLRLKKMLEAPTTTSTSGRTQRYAMGVNVNRSFKLYGWCARITAASKSGGLVEGLPCHTFPTDDGGVDMKCPTEIAITDRRSGACPRTACCRCCTGREPIRRCSSALSRCRSPRNANGSALPRTANSESCGRLPYLFSTCRFAHYFP